MEFSEALTKFTQLLCFWMGDCILDSHSTELPKVISKTLRTKYRPILAWGFERAKDKVFLKLTPPFNLFERSYQAEK